MQSVAASIVALKHVSMMSAGDCKLQFSRGMLNCEGVMLSKSNENLVVGAVA
jgi:hypothetical protein